MKVLIDISEETLKRIKEILNKKKNQSVSEFITLAIENQMCMEDFNNISDIPTIESLIDLDDTPHIKKKENYLIQKKIDKKEIVFVNPIQINDDFPFWGTQNKYLCLKQITLGVIELLSKNKEEWIRYDIVMNYVLQNASNIRKKLEDIDKKLYRPRGEKFSTGFPKNDSKSFTRYEKQFIGGIDGNNQQYGMAIDIGFLSAKKENNSERVLFGITKEGYEFSKIESPIFNSDLTKLTPSSTPFSEEEKDYIINILNNRKKSEINLMKFTLDYIHNGKNHPDEGSEPTKNYLDSKYPNIAKNKKNGSFSILEAETIRSGVISRMNELDLIRIIRKGIKSEYQLTEDGISYKNKWS